MKPKKVRGKFEKMTDKLKVFVDGEEGTTGLEIATRLKTIANIQLLQIESKWRKSAEARRDFLNKADISVLCLPDQAAKEAVTLLENPNSKVIDASTCHRVSEGWIYGFPEYRQGQREAIKESRFITNPGCYAVAAVAILYPLIENEILPKDWPVSISGLSGYSGGGKSLIKKFEQDSYSTKPAGYDYALNLQHKHIPEIMKWGEIDRAPTFLPYVGNFFRGMIVRIPIHLWALPGNLKSKDIYDAYQSHYAGNQFVQLADYDFGTINSQIDPQELNGTNLIKLYTLYDDTSDNSIIVAQLDNLGKGASGQVIQTINIISEANEGMGL